jgi:hypothetical protein
LENYQQSQLVGWYLVVPRGGFEPPTRGFSVFERGLRGIADAIRNELKSTGYEGCRARLPFIYVGTSPEPSGPDYTGTTHAACRKAKSLEDRTKTFFVAVYGCSTTRAGCHTKRSKD